MNEGLLGYGPGDPSSIIEEVSKRPLITAMAVVLGRVAEFKERARAFYFEVMLSPYQCPQCGGRLHMTGQSQAACSCGNTLDPTLSFQRSSCCGAKLIRKTYHYACSCCRQTVPSRFLFDEQLFDPAYFREMMQDYRTRVKQKKEEIRRLLAESRSGVLQLTEEPCLESLNGLTQDLDQFIQNGATEFELSDFEAKSDFHMNDYRNHILSTLSWDSAFFSEIKPLKEDTREDRVWRFVTLVFMDNDGEVDLIQNDNDILIQRVFHEAYS